MQIIENFPPPKKLARMNKLCYILLLLAILSTGCVKDPVERSDADKQKVTLSLGTYAVNDDPNALPEELKIASAYVYIFNAGGYLENAGQVKVPLDTSTGEAVDTGNRFNRTWSVPQGRKHIYVLINPGTLLLDDNSQPDLASYNFKEEDMFTMRNSTVDFDADFSGTKPEGMLMSGMADVVASGDAQTVNIPVARRYACIEFYLRKRADLDDVAIILKKATLSSQNTCGNAFAGYGYPRVPRSVVSSKAAVPLTTSYRNIENYYTMPQSDLSKPVRIDLDITYNGRDMKMPVYINKGALDGGTANDQTRPLNIEANTIYVVEVTIARQNIDVEVGIRDWDDQALKGDIAGSTLVVSQSKVVMDWWNLGQKFDTDVEYVSDGTVSFVGYVIKNADGTDASVTTDGSNLPTWLPKANISGLPTTPATDGIIRMTYVPTPDAHPDVVLRLKTGNITKDITVVYDNGFLPNSLLAAKGWTTYQQNGLHLAKKGNVLPNGTADATWDKEKMQWAAVTTSVPAAKQLDYGYGPSNTMMIIASLRSDATAANTCSSLGTEWYLASNLEMTATDKLSEVLGSSYALAPSDYWSSSEERYDSSYSMLSQYVAASKSSLHYVRCVRNM